MGAKFGDISSGHILQVDVQVSQFFPYFSSWGPGVGMVCINQHFEATGSILSGLIVRLLHDGMVLSLKEYLSIYHVGDRVLETTQKHF